MSLKQNYENACNGYAKAFCRTYELGDYDWIELGEMLDVSDYAISFYDVRYMIHNQIKWSVFVDWYDYCIRLGMIDTEATSPNLKSWCRGCPRKSEEELIALEELHKKVEDMKEELKKKIKGRMLWKKVI